jgi:polyphosphate kinase 2
VVRVKNGAGSANFITSRLVLMRRTESSSAASSPGDQGANLERKKFEQALMTLHVELVKLQLWVKHKGLKVVIVFEGRDAAGKGGIIKRITERVSPRVFRVIALPAPTECEMSQMYIQRYIPYLPAAGEVVIFDRSWYNRALVERVMGFCTKEEVEYFLRMCPEAENSLVRSGIMLIKYWIEVGQEEQTLRFLARIHDGRKIWKLSPMDLESHRRWYDYSLARDAMLAVTDTKLAPWYIVMGDDKRRAQLNCIAHLLSLIPYKDLARRKVRLPKRQKPNGYKEPARRYNYVPGAY